MLVSEVKSCKTLNLFFFFILELRKICVKMLVDMLRVNPLAAEPFLIRDIDRVMNWALPEFSTEILNLLEAEVPDGAIESLGRRISIGLRRGAPVKFSPSNLSVTGEKSRARILSDMIRQINYLREYSEVITRRSKLSGMLAINNLRVISLKYWMRNNFMTFFHGSIQGLSEPSNMPVSYLFASSNWLIFDAKF